MASRVITLLTDFGLKDPYVGVMKGVIYGINPYAIIVDLCHEIPRHDVNVASIILQVSYRYFPKGTIHVCVVDPGVGTKRRSLLVKTRNYYFIGPDNGCLYCAVVDDGVEAVYDISNSPYRLRDASYTFHGRDLFSPIAAYLSIGVPPWRLGIEFTGELVKPSIEFPRVEDGCIYGYIGYVDVFGNLMTNIRGVPWSFGDRLIVYNRGSPIECLFERSFGYVSEGEYVCYINSWGFLEIGVNKGSARDRSGLSIGDWVRVCRV